MGWLPTRVLALAFHKFSVVQKEIKAVLHGQGVARNLDRVEETSLVLLHETCRTIDSTFLPPSLPSVPLSRTNAHTLSLSHTHSLNLSVCDCRFSAPFKEQVKSWSVELASVSEVIELWTVVQSSWIHMEAVFLSGDIAKQLPQEAKRFAGIDKSYMMLTAKAFEVPNVIRCCHGNEQMKTLLPHLAEQLELCQRCLTGYLESKRSHFPRFYFISDSALLEILSHGSDVSMVAGYLQNVFDSLSDVSFDKIKKDVMLTMISREGEEVVFSAPLEIRGSVEEYMTELVATMRSTLKDIARDCASEMEVRCVCACSAFFCLCIRDGCEMCVRFICFVSFVLQRWRCDVCALVCVGIRAC